MKPEEIETQMRELGFEYNKALEYWTKDGLTFPRDEAAFICQTIRDKVEAAQHDLGFWEQYDQQFAKDCIMHAQSGLKIAVEYKNGQQLYTQGYLDAKIAEARAQWHSVDDAMPDEDEYVLARLGWRSGKEVYQVLQHKTLEDNAPWICDGDELDFSVTVTHWQRIAQLKNGVKAE